MWTSFQHFFLLGMFTLSMNVSVLLIRAVFYGLAINLSVLDTVWMILSDIYIIMKSIKWLDWRIYA